MDSERLVTNSFFLQAMIEASYNGVVAVDAKGVIVVFNEAAKKILGIEGADRLGKEIKEVAPDVWPDIQKILKTGLPQIGVRQSVGNSILLENRTPIPLDNGIGGMVSVFQDISEVEKISMKLSSYKNLAKELDTIIESSYDGIGVTDGKGTFLRVNASWEKITGMTAAQVTGRKIVDLEAEGFVSEAIAPLVLKYKKRITKRSRAMGSGKDVLVTSTPIFDEKGDINLVVTNVRDMTDLNNLYKELEHSKRLAKEYHSRLTRMRTTREMDEGIVGVSREMREVIEVALRVAESGAPVLLQGETGVGKEVIANLIHRKSQRSAKGPFVKINCGAIPEALLESELFGYEKGAFTGARDLGKKGRFELAEGGTIFLDEIDSLPLSLQVKLLNAVQDLEIVPIGGSNVKRINARIIAASNSDLSRMVQSNRFREDLFFRLNVVPINIPPLRRRRDDILPLIDFYLEKHNLKYGKTKRFSKSALDWLLAYHWSGNVRELANLVEQLVVLTMTDEIMPENLPSHVMSSGARNLTKYHLDHASSLKQAVREFESKLIQEAVIRHGNARRAAVFLKVDASTITRKLKRFTLSGAKMPNDADVQQITNYAT